MFVARNTATCRCYSRCAGLLELSLYDKTMLEKQSKAHVLVLVLHACLGQRAALVPGGSQACSEWCRPCGPPRVGASYCPAGRGAVCKRTQSLTSPILVSHAAASRLDGVARPAWGLKHGVASQSDCGHLPDDVCL